MMDPTNHHVSPLQPAHPQALTQNGLPSQPQRQPQPDPQPEPEQQLEPPPQPQPQHQPSTCAASNCYHSLSYAYQTYLRHDQDEQNHWEDVCRSFRQYATFAMAQWANHQYRLHALPEEQRQFLPEGLRRDTEEFQRRAAQYKDAAIRNQFFLDCILRHAGQPHSQECSVSAAAAGHSTDSQMSKVSSVLKSLARDWSSEGQPERDMAYQAILQQVQTYVPIPCRTQSQQADGCSPPRICVPGAGVGRLACELSAAGYAVQGNEFSLYMLLASDFILNGGAATPQRPLKISPYLLESRNVHTAADPLRVVQIPDVDPYSMLVQGRQEPQISNQLTDQQLDYHQHQQHQQQRQQPNHSDEMTAIVSNSNSSDDQPMPDVSVSSRVPDPTMAPGLQTTNGQNGLAEVSTQDQQPQPKVDRPLTPPASQQMPEFSMAAGEFVSIYGQAREHCQWDSVVACFFLDASPSIVEYLHVIHDMLKPGGVLINFGPLLWHWSGPAMRPDDKTVQDYQKRYSYLDKKYLTSVDLCWEDVEEIIANIGFEMMHVQTGARALYTADRRSMMNMNYRCIHFVARKKPAVVETTIAEAEAAAIASEAVEEATWEASDAAVAAAAAAAAAAIIVPATETGPVPTPLPPPSPPSPLPPPQPPSPPRPQQQQDNVSTNEVTVEEGDDKDEDADIASLIMD